MWSFLKKFHLIVFALSFLAFFIIGIIAIIALVSFRDNISGKSVLKIELDHELVEQAFHSPLNDQLNLPLKSLESKNGVINIVEALKKAKGDSKIASLFLELRSISGGLGSVEEIRNAILDFKTSGKKVIAYGDYLDEKAYFLASVADSIYLTPEGLMEFNGFSAEISFYKNVLKKLGVEPKVFRVGRFKSAVEPFLRDSISDENRLQVTEFLGSLHNYLLEKVSETRGVSFEELKNISDQLLVRTPKQAVKYGLIDEEKYFDEVLSVVREVSGIAATEKIDFVSANSYWSPEISLGGDEIAVIVADGDIVMGVNQDGAIGGNGMAKLIRKARLTPKIKAIVLRINSPGGSALASDIMWREIKLASETKPVIASMSDLAASGGYYMAMACDTIVAHPNTITGSIGVFGLWFNIEELVSEKIGIHTDRVKTGEFSDIGSITRDVTKKDSIIIQTEINDIYETFVSKAADGRGMSFDDLEAVASGRVWSGAMAKEQGLVDEFGGLNEAIKIAAEAAEITDYSTTYYPRKDGLFGSISDGLEDVKSSSELEILKNTSIYQYYKEMYDLNALEGIQARSPYKIIIK